MKQFLTIQLLATATLLASLPFSAQVEAATDKTLIRDAIIVSGDLATLEQAQTRDILIEGKKIKRIGSNFSVDDETEIVNAKGQYISVGFFNAETQLGVEEIGAVASTRDYASSDARITAALRVRDALNPSSVLIPFNRSLGISHALVQPVSDGGLFAGVASIINLSDGEILEKSSAAMVMDFGESASALVGGSRAAALALIREAFDDALDYSANKAGFNAGNRRDYALLRQDLAALGPVLSGSLPLLVHVNRASDIMAIIKLGKQYRLKLILSGVAEGWRVAQHIAAAKIPVILDPIYNLPSSYEALGTRLDNAKLLNEAGVTLLFTGMGWQNTHNAFLVRQSAGNAVANGLPYQTAIDALTRNPAKVFGLKNVGEIKKGAKANLVIWSGDPLELLSEVKAVFINGKPYALQSRATRLRDRYWQKYQDAK